MRRLLFLTVTVAVAPLSAQIPSTGYASDPVIRAECKLALFHGLNEVYNEQYIEAEDRFDEYSRCDPTDAVGEWRKVYSWYFRLRAEQKTGAVRVSAKTYADFMALAERGVKKAEIRIAAGESPDFYRYVFAEIRAVEAIMTFKNDGIGSYFRSRDILKEVHRIAESSRYQDAKYLRGMMYYQASLSFWGRRFLPSNRCGGLSLIQDAERGNPGIFSDDVRFVVASIAASPKKIIEENRWQCPEYRPRTSFDKLLIRYPRNSLLRDILLDSAK
jgi:hypothetical protein